MKGQLMAIHIGQAKTMTDPSREGRKWRSAILKQPVSGPIWLGRTSLVGDEQADLKHHGGPDKAVLAYASAHYPLWHQELGLSEMEPGGFGENFVVSGMAEPDVCIGDTFRVGEAIIQVSQPRQPCWKLGRRWNLPDLPKRAEETGRTGWYFRVLQEGWVEAGQELVLTDRPFPQWTVARCNEVMHHRRSDRAAAAELAACAALSESWKKTLGQRAKDGTNPDPRDRLQPEAETP